MERIKQAISRARAERGAGEGVAAKPSRSSIDHLSLTPMVEEPACSPSEVRSSGTRTISVDREWLRANRVITEGRDDPIASAYKVLRTRIRQTLQANGWTTLGVTAAREGSGKTLTALNLAISLARDVNQTVLVVDLDLRRPQLGKYLIEGEMPGLSDFLVGRAAVSDILLDPGIDRLAVLPGHEPIRNSSEALSSPKLVKLVEELKRRCPDRIILFDLPPLLVGDDVMAFCPNLDAVLLVAEEGHTTRDDLRHAYALLKQTHIIGTVLNKGDPRTVSQAHGYY